MSLQEECIETFGVEASNPAFMREINALLRTEDINPNQATAQGHPTYLTVTSQDPPVLIHISRAGHDLQVTKRLALPRSVPPARNPGANGYG